MIALASFHVLHNENSVHKIYRHFVAINHFRLSSFVQWRNKVSIAIARLLCKIEFLSNALKFRTIPASTVKENSVGVAEHKTLTNFFQLLLQFHSIKTTQNISKLKFNKKLNFQTSRLIPTALRLATQLFAFFLIASVQRMEQPFPATCQPRMFPWWSPSLLMMPSTTTTLTFTRKSSTESARILTDATSRPRWV